MSPVRNISNFDQAIEHLRNLNKVDIERVNEFMKMLELCETLKLPEQNIPSVAEWNKTPVIFQWLLALAADRLSISNAAYMNLLHSWAEQKEKLDAKKIQPSKPNKQNKKAASTKGG